MGGEGAHMTLVLAFSTGARVAAPCCSAHPTHRDANFLRPGLLPATPCHHAPCLPWDILFFVVICLVCEGFCVLSSAL